MTGTKTNERPGIRAQHRYARFSAYKAREVLDLIRGLPVGEARSLLALSERGAARDIAKILESAVANAGHNNDIPPDELYVSACYADEGPTLRRFRPRARGRASRIRKRTCHITIIVTRFTATELEIYRAKRASRRSAPADAAATRARRVARSRQRSGDATEPQTPEEAADEVVEDTFAETGPELDDADETEATEVTAEAEDVEADDTDDTDTAEATAEAEQPENEAAEATAEAEADENEGGA